MSTIEFFFDCSSPWTYLAFHNIQPLAREMGATIQWRPFMVGGVFNSVNPSVYEFRANPVPAKNAYMAKSMQDWTRVAALKLRFPPTVFPVNSVKVMRACLVLEPQGKLADFAKAAFEAYWAEDLDIYQDEVLCELCARVGADSQGVLAAISQVDVKKKLHANTQELISRGGFGSPTIFVGGHDMYFGNDHLPLVRYALERQLQLDTAVEPD